MSILRFLVLLAAVAMVGCDGGSGAVSVDAPEVTSSGAKTALEAIAESGEFGSEVMEIREGLEKLKETDSAKGDELLADLDELEAMSGSEAIKTKAKEMADKLGGGAAPEAETEAEAE